MKYSIDTSAILDAWTRYYPPDAFPPVWDKLDALIDNGDLKASEEVLEELEKKDDEVYAWALQRERMFVPTSEEIQGAVTEILKNHRRLIDQRPNRSGTDPFVIALAMVEDYVVITGEKPTKSTKRPHIPDVCEALDIRYLNMLGLFREENWVFH